MEQEVNNLERSNFTHVYGVATQINKELNLTKDTNITLDLFSGYANLMKAESVSTITKGEVQLIKRKILKYLKELGIVNTWQESATLQSNTMIAQIYINRPQFDKFYPFVKKRAFEEALKDSATLIGNSKKAPADNLAAKPTVSESIYEITFKDGIIFLNNIYMSKPQFGSINYDFFEEAFTHPNERLNLKELMAKINPESKKKTVHHILHDLKFKGDLKNIFFNAGSSAVEFHNPVSSEMLKAKGIDYLSLVEIGRNLVENSKK